MIDRISRHAAQTLWHSAMQQGACTGFLLARGDCVVGVVTLAAEESLAARLQAYAVEKHHRICGMFYTVLPSVAEVLDTEQAMESLDAASRAASLLHVHLDLHAAGLLKMAAYAQINHRLLPVSLIMETD